MNLELKQKKVLITGVASGIGYAQVIAFLEEGAIVYGIDVQKNRNVRQLLEAWPSRFSFALIDLSNINDMDKVQINNFGNIDILINTAGILDNYASTLQLNMTEGRFENVMNTNFKSVVQLTNLVLPKMLKQGNGVIVNTASIAGLVAGGGGAAYTSAKHAIIGYTKQLDYDFAAVGIRANCIAPGAIKTPMNAADFEGKYPMADKVAEQTPARRWAEPQEVADLTLFLASNKADYIHGVTVPIDGGWLEK